LYVGNPRIDYCFSQQSTGVKTFYEAVEDCSRQGTVLSPWVTEIEELISALFMTEGVNYEPQTCFPMNCVLMVNIGHLLWTGLQKKSGVWFWADGHPINETYILADHRIGQRIFDVDGCVIVQKKSGILVWLMESCSNTHPFVCQTNATNGMRCPYCYSAKIIIIFS
jgi:hypothetical protein